MSSASRASRRRKRSISESTSRNCQRSVSTSRDRKWSSYSPRPKKSRRSNKSKTYPKIKKDSEFWRKHYNGNHKRGRKKSRRYSSSPNGGRSYRYSSHHISSSHSERRKCNRERRTKRHVGQSRREDFKVPVRLPHQLKAHLLHWRDRVVQEKPTLGRAGSDFFKQTTHGGLVAPHVSEPWHSNSARGKGTKKRARHYSRRHKLPARLPPKRRGSLNSNWEAGRLELRPPPPGLPPNAPSEPKVRTRFSSQLLSKSTTDKGGSDIDYVTPRPKDIKDEDASLFEDIRLRDPEDRSTRLRRILGPMLPLLIENCGPKKFDVLKKLGLANTQPDSSTTQQAPRERRLTELLSLIGPVSKPSRRGRLIWSRSVKVSSMVPPKECLSGTNLKPEAAPINCSPPSAKVEPFQDGDVRISNSKKHLKNPKRYLDFI